MFTGLVQTMGTVVNLLSEGAGRRLSIRVKELARGVDRGESIAVNGVCLTAVAVENEAVDFQIGPETLEKTSLGQLQAGNRVNLERSLRVGDELGGHWVQGHVDGVGIISSREKQGDWELVRVQSPPGLTALMVPKGSIAVDGVSLTLVDVEKNHFSVALIPHTLAQTALGFKKIGDSVNLETDILGKYVAKYLSTLTSGS